jgi:hypothetical protein
MAEEPHSPWKMVLIGQRVLTYMLGPQAGFLPVQFHTTSQFGSLFINLNDAQYKQVREGLAELGLPIGGICLHNPKLVIELLPLRSTRDSDVWKEVYELERLPMCISPDLAWLIKCIQQCFKEKQKDLSNHCHSHPPITCWVIEQGHPKQAEAPSPFYCMHGAH